MTRKELIEALQSEGEPSDAVVLDSGSFLGEVVTMVNGGFVVLQPSIPAPTPTSQPETITGWSGEGYCTNCNVPFCNDKECGKGNLCCGCQP